jgi:predicted Rossmann fold flavoprotein
MASPARDPAYDAIVLGGGAAGLMCAIEAGRGGKRVLVLERNPRLGEKIRISGGGRCNFTNIIVEPGHYLSENSHFCTSALARFTPGDFLALVERHGIAYHEKAAGQLFCDTSSREILGMLAAELSAAAVEVRTGCAVAAVRKDDVFRVATGGGEFRSTALVVATGGLSIPSLGASDFGYAVARQFGLRVTDVRPGLVPLVCAGPDGEMMKRLSGISVDAEVRCAGAAFREQVLFTHRGLSGPAILQISSYWTPGASVELDILPGVDLAGALTAAPAPKEMAAFLARFLPRRLAVEWVEKTGFTKAPSQAPRREILAFEEGLHHWEVRPDGTEGFGKAEVTCGGVSTAELSSKTMEAGKVPGLYFVGEVIDVTGHLGGYNFQWAWASGAAAGRALSGKPGATP